ncbi:MAG: hypothetical protein AAF351_12235 [Pseudomonadota bacterium]
MSKIHEALRKVRESSEPAKTTKSESTNVEVSVADSEGTGSLASLDETITLSTLTDDQIPEHLRDADKRYAGRPVVVDLATLHAEGYLSDGDGQHRLADELRLIKRPILANARGKRVVRPELANLVMVGSALSNEGKTFTCINLALSIASERDWNVLLIDSDTAKQHLTDLFAAGGERGLLDLLRDPSLDPNDLIMPTNIPSLSVLPAGQRDNNAAELLASERMDQLAREISNDDKFRITIFDSSPLLLTTESAILSSHVGQIALVVSAGHTSQSDVTSAVEKLDSSKSINAILNKAESSSVGSYGGYYGYYGRESTDDDDKE